MPDETAKKEVSKVVNTLTQIDPRQYYYSLDQLHITLLGEIDAKIDINIVKDALDSILSRYIFSFKLFGLASNQYVSSITAHPLFSIHLFREELRKTLGVSGTDYTIHLPTYEYMAWISYMRYLHYPSQELLDKLYDYKDTIFCTFTSPLIEVYKNSSRVLDPSKSKLLYSKRI